MAKSDWDKSFPEKFLHAADAMTRLEHWLEIIGLGNSPHFNSLKSDFIRHGGATLNDIEKSRQHGGSK